MDEFMNDSYLMDAASKNNMDMLTLLDKADIRMERVPAPRNYIIPGDETKTVRFGVPPVEARNPDIDKYEERPVLYIDNKPNYDSSLDKDSFTRAKKAKEYYNIKHNQYPSSDEADSRLKQAQERANIEREKRLEAAKAQTDPVKAKRDADSFKQGALEFRRGSNTAPPPPTPTPQSLQQKTETAVMGKARELGDRLWNRVTPNGAPTVTVRPEVEEARLRSQAKIDEIKNNYGIAPKPTQIEGGATMTPSNFTPKSLGDTRRFETTFKPEAEVVERVNSIPAVKDMPPIVKAVIAVESGGRFDAKSPTGTRGIAQMTKAAMQDVLPGGDVNNPEDQLLGSALYIAKVTNMKAFKNNPYLGLAAYNGGPGLLSRAVEVAGTTDWDTVKSVLPEVMKEEKFANYFKKKKVNLDQKYNEIVSYPDKVLSYYNTFTGNDELITA